MTPNDHSIDGDLTAERGVDRILDHHRQQLSALLDGELPPDEARFLLRRLQHDPELLDCWTRWQQAGDCMRQRPEVPLPGSFALAVAQAVAREPSLVAGSGGHRLRWAGGAALAASAAVLALMLARPTPQAGPGAAPESPRIAAAPAPAPVAPTPERPPAVAGELATALVVADVPRRIGAARRSRSQSQRAALRTPATSQQVANADTTIVATAVAAPAVTPNAAIDPFSGQRISVVDRPWPRALLPASPASGSFNVDYGTRRAVNPALYPFAPRNAAEPSASDVRP